MHPKTSGISVIISSALAAGVMYQTYNAATWLYNNINKFVSPQYTNYTQPIFLTGAFASSGAFINTFRGNSAISRYLAGGISTSLIYAFSAITFTYLSNNYSYNNWLASACISLGSALCSALVWNHVFENGINPILKIGADTLDKVIGFICDKTGLDLSDSRSFTTSLERKQSVKFSIRS